MKEERFNEIIENIYYNRNSRGTEPAQEILEYIKELKKELKESRIKKALLPKYVNEITINMNKILGIIEDPEEVEIKLDGKELVGMINMTDDSVRMNIKYNH